MPRAKKTPIVEPVVVKPIKENTTNKNGKRPATDILDNETSRKKPTSTRTLATSKEVNSKNSQPQRKNKNSPLKEEDISPKPSKLQRVNSVRGKKQTVPPTVIEGAALYCFGMNDCGQLGFQCEKRKFPALVPALEGKKIVSIACGGMHTVVLEDNGKVWTFGLNDDGALGRHTAEEEDSFEPGTVDLPKKVTSVSAGDSHSAALTEDGNVYIWGCFKDGNGNFGLVAEDGDMCRQNPVLITNQINEKIKKICSGGHHIAMLGEDGNVYTCGTGDQGQLGRQQLEERRVTRSSGAPLSRKEFLLIPAIVKVGLQPKINDIWTGEFSTYYSVGKSNEIYVCGLNNYGQLGIKVKGKEDKNVIHLPTKGVFLKGTKWKQIAAGQHHVVALDEQGNVFTFGRTTDGRLGLGPPRVGEEDNCEKPTKIVQLEDKKIVSVAAGATTSYAITKGGQLFSWGFGENWQLAVGDDDDRNVPTQCYKGRDVIIDGGVVSVSAGGLHAAVAILPPQVLNGQH